MEQCFSVYYDIDELRSDIAHYNQGVFPVDAGWYRLLQKHVFGADGNNRYFLQENHAGTQSILLPMRTEKLYGLFTLSAMQNYYSTDYRPFITSNECTDLTASLLDGICALKRPVLFTFEPVDVHTPEWNLMIDALKRTGYSLRYEPVQSNWYHRLESDYSQYIGSRPTQLKNTIRRKYKLLEKTHQHSIKIYNSRSNVDEVIEAYQLVYENSWKQPEPSLEFIPDLIRYLANSNTLYMGVLMVEDQAIATQLWVLQNQTAYIYKLAYDKKYRKLSPGTVLMADMIRQVMESENINRLDFMSGDDEYKKMWMNEKTIKYRALAFDRKSIFGRIGRLYFDSIRPLMNRAG